MGTLKWDASHVSWEQTSGEKYVEWMPTTASVTVSVNGTSYIWEWPAQVAKEKEHIIEEDDFNF